MTMRVDKTILVTGAAGFIGANLVMRLLDECVDCHIVGLDNMSDFYDVKLKQARLQRIGEAARLSASTWTFVHADISDKAAVESLFKQLAPEIVIHLAAQAGVRYSIDHPDVYIQSNIVGFFNVLEACRHHPVDHLIYASSSSVYGDNAKIPFSVDDKADYPVSLYAATKKSDELLAYAYCKLYGIPTTGLRFFTVYGPYGRPDMFIYSATVKLLAGETIQLYNYGECQRDFTYIDDIIEGVMRVIGQPHVMLRGDDPAELPYALYNIGGGHPVVVRDVVCELQCALIEAGALAADHDASAQLELVEPQPGDVLATFADTTAFEEAYGFAPAVDIREGIRRFVSWYLDYTRGE